jgi:hypothetical protein
MKKTSLECTVKWNSQVIFISPFEQFPFKTISQYSPAVVVAAAALAGPVAVVVAALAGPAAAAGPGHYSGRLIAAVKPP